MIKFLYGRRSTPRRPFTARHNIDDGKLEQSREDKHEASEHPHIDGFDVGHSGHGGVGAACLGGDGQYSQQAEGNPSRSSLDTDPEAYPGQDHNEDARDEDLDEKEAYVPTQHKADFQAWECAWRKEEGKFYVRR